MLEIYREGLALASAEFQRGGQQHGHLPSACSGWTIIDVVRHNIHTQSREVLSDPVPTDPSDGELAAVDDDAVLATWRELAGRLPDRARDVDPQQLYFPALDMAMHAWDVRHGLVKAGLSNALEFSSTLMDWMESFRAKATEQAIRQPGIFGAPQPAPVGASRSAAFMAWAGREI